MIASKIACMGRTVENAGDRIRRARKAAGLTQEQLAEIVGVSRPTITQWETGSTKTMRFEHIFKAARALQKNPEWLITGQGHEKPPEWLARAVDVLPPADQREIVDYILYRFDKVGTLFASDKLAHYVAMLEDFRNDLNARKKRDGEPDEK